MHATIIGQRKIRIHRERVCRWVRIVVVAQAFVSCAYSQYLFDPANADEQMGGIRYFGSAKDDKGVLIPGVTVFIEYGSNNSFVFVTDEQGRYHGNLPATLLEPEKISSKCSKPGYQFVKVMRRPGMNAPKPYVQLDCVLRPAASASD